MGSDCVRLGILPVGARTKCHSQNASGRRVFSVLMFGDWGLGIGVLALRLEYWHKLSSNSYKEVDHVRTAHKRFSLQCVNVYSRGLFTDTKPLTSGY